MGKRDDPKHSLDALHIFAQNTKGLRDNSFMLKNISNKLFSIPPKDKIPKNYLILDISQVQNRKWLETCGLATL